MNTAINKNFSPQTKSFILSTVAVSITIWNVSFNLGAFGDIFFNDFFTVWVIASVTLLCCLLLPKRQSPVGRLGLLIMAFPTVGFMFSFLDNITVNPAIGTMDLFISGIAYVICLPYTIHVIYSIHHQEIVGLSKKLFIKVALIAVIIGMIGYSIGSHNYLFLTCSDFKISGNDLPTNCRQ